MKKVKQWEKPEVGVLSGPKPSAVSSRGAQSYLGPAPAPVKAPVDAQSYLGPAPAPPLMDGQYYLGPAPGPAAFMGPKPSDFLREARYYLGPAPSVD